MEIIKLLNVKLPFIEAIEHLKNSNDVIACVNYTTMDSSPVIVSLNDNDELKIINNSLYVSSIFKEEKIGQLKSSHILKDEWCLVIKLNLY